LICKSLIKYKGHNNSHVAAARALYSASEEYIETVNCFFVLHDIKDFSRKKHCPETGLLESMHPAQSTYKKPNIVA